MPRIRLFQDRNHSNSKQPRTRPAFTLIELMTVITIIGMLMAMLLPAVQEVRESARKVVCKNNLKQLGAAVIGFRTQFGRYPSGGWGYNWTGDPGAGYGKSQPGGWMYSIIPFLDAQDVVEKAEGENDKTKKTNAAVIMGREMELFLCPSRRPVQTYPIKSTPLNCDPLTLAARTDYAINCGDQERCQLDGGPTNVNDGRSKDWWAKYVTKNSMYDTTKQMPTFTGISFPYGEVDKKLRDNEHYVYLAAEKWVNPSNYLNGTDPGDLYGAYAGFGASSYRSGFNSPWRDNAPFITGSSTCSWGGPHANNFHAVFCDGSVRAIRYGINISVHKNLANAFDGLPNPPDDQM